MGGGGGGGGGVWIILHIHSPIRAFDFSYSILQNPMGLKVDSQGPE